MKKQLKVLIFGLPVLLILVSSILDFAANSAGEAIAGTSLIDFDMFFGTINSMIFSYTILAFLGITLFISEGKLVVGIGKALYSAAMTSGVFLLLIMMEGTGLTDEVSTVSFAIGGIIFLLGAILGLIMALSFLFGPIIDDLIKNIYGNDSISTNKENGKDPFSAIREWKLMLDENVISDEEYSIIKEDLLNNIKFKKGSLINTITILKSLEQEGLISHEDFESKKKEALVK